jgi:predicted Rossmann fold flavoprotein
MQDSNPYRDPNHKRVLVVGGGAAGFFTAIKIAEENPSVKVTILEQGKNVLSKVRISGGGRCNLAHAEFIPRELSKNYPRGQRELMGPFNSFSSGDTMAWFEERGVDVKIEEDGRIFPISDSSQTVIDCFLNACKANGVSILTKRKVLNIYPPEEEQQCWKAICANGESYYGDFLVVATGSSNFMWEQISHLGHTIVPPVPSLFTFNIKDPRIKDLMGLSVPNAEVQIKELKAKNHGPLLITHWGMSGPGILKISAVKARELHDLNYEFKINVNWIMEKEPDVIDQLNEQKKLESKKKIHNTPLFQLPKRLWQSLCTYCEINADLRWADLSKKQMHSLCKELCAGVYKVRGKSTFKEEFVTAGGVKLKEVDFKTYESKILYRLYFTGEALDIDAVTGGFNFQAAWTSGFLAGQAILNAFNK